MQKTKALIFDVDGTAVNSPTQKLPTQRLNKAVSAVEEYYYICAATGRPWSWAEPIFREMGLVDPCIVAGGTQICDPKTGEILWQSTIEKRDIQKVKTILMKYPAFGLLINDYDEEGYYNGARPASQLNADENIFFMNYIFIPHDIAVMIVDDLKAIEGITHALGTSQKHGYIDILITNRAATKEHAITELLTRLNVDKKHTYGFGDGLNDSHLFNAVNTKIAMGNAVPELKAIADEVIDPVSEDGLAQYFERLGAIDDKS